MKPRHVLFVHEPVERFVPLFEAVRAADLRAGWLELAPPPPLPAFDTATSAGALRAVAAGDGRVLSLKRLRGTPVLGDLLREHFLGCTVVLVRGEPDHVAAELRRPHAREATPWHRLRAENGGGSFTLESPEGESRKLELAALVARLRRPRLG